MNRTRGNRGRGILNHIVPPHGVVSTTHSTNQISITFEGGETSKVKDERLKDEHKVDILETPESVAQEEPILFWEDMEGEEYAGSNKEDIITFEFPIIYPRLVTQMKNIPPSSLPNFHGLASEVSNAFLFEFDVLCIICDYYTNSHKLNLFPSTLKGVSLRWFMGLAENNIQTWEDMKKVFLKRYQDYCKAREEIFRMTQGEDEILEEYVERF
jgi:hypothetical protein